MLRNSLCSYHCYLDNDEAGRKSIQKAMEQGYLNDSNYNVTSCPNFSNSEFEDLIEKSIYESAIFENFGINLSTSEFRGSDTVWSNRIKRVALSQGKIWDDKLESEMKFCVANLIKENSSNCLHDVKRGSIDALVTSLENLIN